MTHLKFYPAPMRATDPVAGASADFDHPAAVLRFLYRRLRLAGLPPFQARTGTLTLADVYSDADVAGLVAA